MSDFFSSDFHLGDERMEIFGRPFANADECKKAIVANCSKVVRPSDRLIIIGDVAVEESALKALDEIPCRKVLIRGNYDKLSAEVYSKYFEQVEDEMFLNIDEKENDGLNLLYLNHYPSRSVTEAFNLCGHIHGAWRVQKNAINVGVDANHFRPLSLEQVVFYYRAICKFYDEDVWVANHVANAAHDYRGKQGTYWQTGNPGSLHNK